MFDEDFGKIPIIMTAKIEKKHFNFLTLRKRIGDFFGKKRHDV